MRSHTSPPTPQTDAATTSSRGSSTDVATLARRQQALFSVATSPVKNCAMMAFMMYMAGTQLHFFSIMATFNGLYSPLNAILKSGLSECLLRAHSHPPTTPKPLM